MYNSNIERSQPRIDCTVGSSILGYASMNNDTTFSIYRIVHFASGRCYVGQSNNPKHRISTHYSLLKHNTHKNEYLQKAWNKYGKSSFYSEIIENGILKKDADERERYWIAYFDSYKNGFNGTIGGYGTGGKPSPCEWNGIRYGSITEAAEALGIDFRAMQRRFQRDCHCDADMHGSKKGCIWNGVFYETVREAAIALGITTNAMKSRIYKSSHRRTRIMPPQDNENNPACKLSNQQVIEIRERYAKGGIYQRELAREYNVTRVTISMIVNHKRRSGL